MPRRSLCRNEVLMTGVRLTGVDLFLSTARSNDISFRIRHHHHHHPILYVQAFTQDRIDLLSKIFPLATLNFDL